MADSQSSPTDKSEPLLGLLKLGLEAGRPPPAPKPAASTIVVGAVIDDYEILEEIGRGGMGIVYKAKHHALDRIVALKVLSPQLANDRRAAQRISREAHLAARLNHPNIVTIYDIDRHKPPRYFVMEYIEGRSLGEVVTQEGALSPTETVRITMAVCAALHEAHHKKIIHRDIKPSNILLTPTGVPKVTDFGIAQPLKPDSTPEKGDQAGTRDFMPPEQKRRGEPEERTDVFALGMTMYYMLTGRTAAWASPSIGPSLLFSDSAYQPPSSSNPAVSDELDRVVLRMIAPLMSDRYRNCEVVAQELARVAACEEHARAVEKAERLRRRRVWLKIMGALAVFALMMGGIQIFRSLRQGQGAGTIPHHVTYAGPAATVWGRNGQTLWSIKVDGTLLQPELARLSPRELPSLIVGVRDLGRDAGKVMVYNSRGELAWAKDLATPYPYGGDSDNRMMVNSLRVADLKGDGNLRIVALAHDLGRFPCKLAILDRHGTVESTYWHPGQFADFLIYRSALEPRLRILAWGLNNDMRAARPGADQEENFGAIVCLDPQTMSGEAPPRHGVLGKGNELWYGLLLPQKAKIREVKIRPATAGQPEGQPGQTIQITVSDYSFIYLDENGNYLSRALGDAYRETEPARIELQH